jgi:hypothetical protein
MSSLGGWNVKMNKYIYKYINRIPLSQLYRIIPESRSTHDAQRQSDDAQKDLFGKVGILGIHPGSAKMKDAGKGTLNSALLKHSGGW